MDSLLETIRAATASDATDEARAAGAAACRTILTALEAQQGQPLALVAPTTSPIATAVAALRGMPPDQLIDIAIARLRAALPEDASVPPVESPKFHIIQVPPSIRGRS